MIIKDNIENFKLRHVLLDEGNKLDFQAGGERFALLVENVLQTLPDDTTHVLVHFPGQVGSAWAGTMQELACAALDAAGEDVP